MLHFRPHLRFHFREHLKIHQNVKKKIHFKLQLMTHFTLQSKSAPEGRFDGTAMDVLNDSHKDAHKSAFML